MRSHEQPNERESVTVATCPLVSIIVPHYNRQSLLPALMQNVVAQTYRPIELLIVDDGSDFPVNLGEDVYEGVSMRVISLPHTGRPGLVRNVGIDEANGDFIAFLDSDDVWVPEKLLRQVNIFREFHEVGLVHGNAYIMEGKKKTHFLKGFCTGYSTDYFSLLKRNIVFTSSVMVRRSLFQTDRFSGLKSAQDYELWLKLAKKYKFYYVEDPLYVYDHISDVCVSRNGVRRYLCLLVIFRSVLRNSEMREVKRIVVGRIAGFYFKLAKHSFLAHREKRSVDMLYKSLMIRPNIYAFVALLLSCSYRLSLFAFTQKRDC